MSKSSRDGGQPRLPDKVLDPARQSSSTATDTTFHRSNRPSPAAGQAHEDVWTTAGLNIVPLHLPVGGTGTSPHPPLPPTASAPFDAACLLRMLRSEHTTPRAYQLANLLREPLVEPLTPTLRLSLIIQKGFVASFLHPGQGESGPRGAMSDASQPIDASLPDFISPAVSANFTPQQLNPYNFALDRQIHSIQQQLAHQRMLYGEILRLNREHRGMEFGYASLADPIQRMERDLMRSESTLKILSKRRDRGEVWWNEFSKDIATVPWTLSSHFRRAIHELFERTLSPLVRCYALVGLLEENVVLAPHPRRDRHLKENVAAIFIQEKATPGVYAALIYGLLLDAATEAKEASNKGGASGPAHQASVIDHPLSARPAQPAQLVRPATRPNLLAPADSFTTQRDVPTTNSRSANLPTNQQREAPDGGSPVHQTRSVTRARRSPEPHDHGSLPIRPTARRWLGRYPGKPTRRHPE